MRTDRIENYRKIEELLKSKLLIYITSDRRNLETKIASDILIYFTNHLDIIGGVPKISLYLYTRGGETLSAWSLVNLIRNFCKDFEVIIPFHCHSAGTLICLGANRIIMTKQATLGPIDPSINGIMNPQVNINNKNVKVPVSVEFVNGYLEMVTKELKIKNNHALSTIITNLSNQIHPLSLGEVQRSKTQIQMLARKLLKYQKINRKKQNEIIKFLCKESGSHDYTIYRREAKEDLGLNIEKPDDNLYKIIKEIFVDIQSEMELNNPFDPKILTAQDNTYSYSFRRALIESINGGSDVFISEGTLNKQIINQPGPVAMQKTIVQDSRKYEGWRHES